MGAVLPTADLPVLWGAGLSLSLVLRALARRSASRAAPGPGGEAADKHRSVPGATRGLVSCACAGWEVALLQRRPLEPGTRRAGVWRGGPGGFFGRSAPPKPGRKVLLS